MKLYTEKQLYSICHAVAEKASANSLDMEYIEDKCNYYGNSKINIDIKAIFDMMENDNIDEIIVVPQVDIINNIQINNIANFRKELITLIEQLLYRTGRYYKNNLSSTEIAKLFEKNISICKYNQSSRYDSNKFMPPFRLGRKNKRAILDVNGKELIIFPRNNENQAQLYCDYLNGL